MEPYSVHVAGRVKERDDPGRRTQRTDVSCVRNSLEACGALVQQEAEEGERFCACQPGHWDSTKIEAWRPTSPLIRSLLLFIFCSALL